MLSTAQIAAQFSPKDHAKLNKIVWSSFAARFHWYTRYVRGGCDQQSEQRENDKAVNDFVKRSNIRVQTPSHSPKDHRVCNAAVCTEDVSFDPWFRSDTVASCLFLERFLRAYVGAYGARNDASV